MSVDPAAISLAKAAAEIDLLQEFPLLRSLAEETADASPRPGEVGLAVQMDPSGVLWFLIASDDGT